MYFIQPYGYVIEKKQTLLQTVNGVFEVNSDALASLIIELSNYKSIKIDSLQKLIRSKTQDNLDDVIDYLIKDIGVLREGNFKQNLDIQIFGSSDRILSLFKNSWDDIEISIYECKNFEKLNLPNMLSAIFFDGYPDEAYINRTIKLLPSNSCVILIYQIRECFVISSIWRPNSGVPCPKCNIDYSFDRVFFDPSEVGMGISDIFDFTRNSNYPRIPKFPISNLDLHFVSRFLRQYVESLSGTGFLGMSPFDPLSHTVINISNLKHLALKIPFSPHCNCLRKFHQHFKEQEDA